MQPQNSTSTSVTSIPISRILSLHSFIGRSHCVLVCCIRWWVTAQMRLSHPSGHAGWHQKLLTAQPIGATAETSHTPLTVRWMHDIIFALVFYTHQYGIHFSLSKLRLLLCSFSSFSPLITERFFFCFVIPARCFPLSPSPLPLFRLLSTFSSRKSFLSALSSLPPRVPVCPFHPPCLTSPPAPQATAACALQSAVPVFCCLPRPPHHPLPSPCAFRSPCLIHELPVAPVMSHLCHRKAQCK